jgi:hypothetical protein
LHGLGHLLDIARLGQIGSNHNRLSPESLDPRSDLFRPRSFAAVIECQVGTLLGHEQRDRGTDAPRRARDQGGSSLEPMRTPHGDHPFENWR